MKFHAPYFSQCAHFATRVWWIKIKSASFKEKGLSAAQFDKEYERAYRELGRDFCGGFVEFAFSLIGRQSR